MGAGMQDTNPTVAAAKDAVRRVLMSKGFTLARTGHRERVTEMRFTPEEMAAFHRDVDQLGLNDQTWEIFTKPGTVKAYAAPERVNSYHQTVDAAVAAGVRFGQGAFLDVGTCTGYMMRIIKSRWPDMSVTGTDFWEECVRLAAALVPDGKVFRASIDELAAGGPAYDVVFATEVLEHVGDTETQIPKMLGLLNPGGALVVTVPNGRFDVTPALTSPDGVSYGGHINFWSPESWRFYIDRMAGDRRHVVGPLGVHYADDSQYAVIFAD